MKTKIAGLAAAVFAVSVSFASVSHACGAGECEPVKGNNGWGNGADATNAGSDAGGTSGSKTPNGYGTGPGPGKFTTR